MRAILIGGPRHLHEFEIDGPPHVWLVPKIEPFKPPQKVGDDPYAVQRAHFQTHAYRLQREQPGGYAIYLSEDS